MKRISLSRIWQEPIKERTCRNGSPLEAWDKYGATLIKSYRREAMRVDLKPWTH